MAQSYDVFMSYRHKPLDGEITQRTFNFLEKYKLPKALVQEGCRQITRVFRDTEELAVSRILTHTIDEALRSAEFVVIVCSTQTPESEWVDREVMTFTEMGKAGNIYPLLINGSPEESFPKALKAIPDIMDRVMDARCPGDDPDAIMKKTEQLILRVVAAFAGCSEDRLRREHSMRASRTIAARGITAAAVFTMVAAVSISLWNLAVNYRQKAMEAQSTSMTILQELTYDLPTRLSDQPGTYARLATNLQANAKQIQTILELSGNDPAVRNEIGVNYEKLCTAYRAIGCLPEAEEAARGAIAEFETNSDDSTTSHTRLASAYNDLGSVLSAAGRYQEAGECFDRAVKWQSIEDCDSRVLSTYIGNTGINEINSGSVEKGLELLEQALIMGADKQWSEPSTLGTMYLQYGKALRKQLRFQDAERVLEKGMQIYDEEYDYRQYENQYLQLADEYALCFANSGNLSRALKIYEQLVSRIDTLDRENVNYFTQLSQLYNNYAQALNLAGRLEEANTAYMQAAVNYEKIAALTGSASDAACYATTCLNIADNAFTAGDYETSRLWFDKGLTAYDPVAEELVPEHISVYLSYRAFYKLTFGSNTFEALQDSLEALENFESILTYDYCATMCMFQGETETADLLFAVLIENGATEQIRQVFQALTDYGLHHPHMDEVLAALNNP